MVRMKKRALESLDDAAGWLVSSSIGVVKKEDKDVQEMCVLSVVMVLILGLFACGSPKGDLFPDSKLEKAIWAAIGRPAEAILPSDLEELSSLDAAKGGTTDLTGLEYCTSLTELDLHANQISDISPLLSLTNLTLLNIEENPLDTESVEVRVPQLEERGVEVRR